MVDEVVEVARSHAQEVDSTPRFPIEALGSLRLSGLMGLVVPTHYGGLGGNLADVVEVARGIAGSCLSTALAWGMHCQQVAVLTAAAHPTLADSLLPRIAAGDVYIASVTTESGRSGELTDVKAALGPAVGGRMALSRDAPVVTGGAEADAFLVTMRRGTSSNAASAVFVIAERSQIAVTPTRVWNGMGVRGTASSGLQLQGFVSCSQLIDPPGGIGAVVADVFVPYGHAAWGAAWLGAAESAFWRVVDLLRSPETRASVGPIDDRLAERLGRARAHIATAEAVLERFVTHFEESPAEVGRASWYVDPAFVVETNNVKVLVSEAALAAVDVLMELVGLRLGYVADSPLALERTFRDLRSAPLMYPNHRLLAVNGRVTLFERNSHL